MKSRATFQWSENISARNNPEFFIAHKNILHRFENVNRATVMQFFFLVSFLLFFGIACKKETTPSTQGPSGPSTLTFNYTGFKTGTFSAVGEYLSPAPAGGGQTDYNWATSQHFTDFGKKWTLVTANTVSPVSSRAYSGIQLTITDNGTGNFSLPGSFSSEDLVVFGDAIASGNPQELYRFTSGNVQITTSNLNRVVGNFTGTATDVNTPGRTIQITNGKFDLSVTQ